MTFRTVWIDDLDRDVRIPQVWSICPSCRGDGSTSSHLGTFTHEDLYELGDDFRQDYAAGRYDRPCPDCDGSGKVREDDWESCPKEVRDALEAESRGRYEADMADMHEARQLGGW